MVETGSSPACNFQGKDSQETFQTYFRQHWIRLLWPFFRLILVSTLLIVVGWIMFFVVEIPEPITRHSLYMILFSLFLIMQLEFLNRFYRHFLYIIVVTDRKVHRIKKTLFLIDDHQSVDLWSLQDIFKCQHGIVQNIFRFGTLILEAQDTRLRIHFIPNISDKYKLLTTLRERARTAGATVLEMKQFRLNKMIKGKEEKVPA